ncbi:MAG TPA: 2OG-Fe(II) oxygenase [Cyclobacteriaceae bacterium]|nr:2OG-Fe(II) oxygenase [Cyclobacteriaceae bacterium]
MRDLDKSDWVLACQSLNEKGFARLPRLLSSDECNYFSGLYDEVGIYRNTINMKRYRFGMGEYKYFSYPLPAALESMRKYLYQPLVPLANEWMQCLSVEKSFPSSHTDLIHQCQQAGQTRPTPLILKYEIGGFNTLHQDLYGDIYFPFQLVIVLRQEGKDFEGGEFVMTEQVPRAQSIAHVVHANQGDAIVFTTNFRPAKGTRGYYRATMKHGISEVTSGERFALGIIFHDAK